MAYCPHSYKLSLPMYAISLVKEALGGQGFVIVRKRQQLSQARNV